MVILSASRSEPASKRGKKIMGFWPFLGSDEGHRQGCAGWKYIAALDIPGHAEKTASEAVALLTALHCPIDTVMDIIIGGSPLDLQVHESCGHPIELDRVMGAGAAYAGTSFLTLDQLNNFNYVPSAATSPPTACATLAWGPLVGRMKGSQPSRPR